MVLVYNSKMNYSDDFDVKYAADANGILDHELCSNTASTMMDCSFKISGPFCTAGIGEGFHLLDFINVFSECFSV